MKDNKVLVTGPGGFIASHLVERLIAEGAKVRAFVRYNSRGDAGLLRMLPVDVYSQLEVVAGDLRVVEAVRDAMMDIDTVFHLGALIAIPYSYVHPREVIATNVMGTLNVLRAARELRTRRVIHTYTSEVYGTAQYVPIDEKHPLQGQSPYSADIDRVAEMKQFEWNQALVMIHGHDRIKISVRSLIEQGISRVGTGGRDTRLSLPFQ